jgi:hypothetical protein
MAKDSQEQKSSQQIVATALHAKLGWPKLRADVFVKKCDGGILSHLAAASGKSNADQAMLKIIDELADAEAEKAKSKEQPKPTNEK